MGKKRFGIYLTLAEYYAIRNALRLKGDEPELLAKVEEKIKNMHKYFDGNLHAHLCGL